MILSPKPLSELLRPSDVLSVHGDLERMIVALTSDSRNVKEGSLFVAVSGTTVDGHQFIENALRDGAVAIICEKAPESNPTNATIVVVKEASSSLGFAASAFFDHPSGELKLVGVTGTNGKTSVATFLFQLFRNLGYRCGLLSTVKYQIQDEIIPATHTTPDALRLNELLREMKQKGCSHVFMEVSSHAVVQNRIAGLTFSGGIFTNITHDHLDFHKTFDNYIAAKKMFFDNLPPSSFALVNADDRRAGVMVQNTQAYKSSFSFQGMANFKGKILAESLEGTQLEINGHEVWLMLIGRFNAYNALAAYGAAILLGEREEDALRELSRLLPPPGRFQQFHSANNITSIVDYAHTPDALENVLETIRALKLGTESVTVVVGCGGNRDITKRPKMAQIASKLADIVILTSDNPRFEEPNEIIQQMLEGVPTANLPKVITITDRKEAIFKAVKEAEPGDILLVAGKGHENYQEIKGVKHHFDDTEVILEAFEELSKTN